MIETYRAGDHKNAFYAHTRSENNDYSLYRKLWR